MKYTVALTFFKLVPGQENRNFLLVLDEMGSGWKSGAWYFDSPDLRWLRQLYSKSRHIGMSATA